MKHLDNEYSNQILQSRGIAKSKQANMITVESSEMKELINNIIKFVETVSGGGMKGMSIVNHETDLVEAISFITHLLGKEHDDILPKDKLAIHGKFAGISGNYQLLDPVETSQKVLDFTQYATQVMHSQANTKRLKDTALPRDIERKIKGLKELISTLNGSCRLVTQSQLDALNIFNGTPKNLVDYKELNATVDKTLQFLEETKLWVKGMGREVTLPKQTHMIFILAVTLAAAFVAKVAATVKMKSAIMRFIGRHLNFKNQQLT